MLAEVVRCLLVVAAVTVPVDDMVGCRAVTLAGDLGGAIGQKLYIARQHNLDRAIHPAIALRQLGLGFGSNLGYSCTPSGSGRITEVRSRNFFPRQLMNCYHDTNLHMEWTV
jgi:hypothetical protein